MAANKHIFVRVTRNQFERIRVNAQANGFVTVSEYIRNLALEKDLCFQDRFNRLFSKVMDEEAPQVKRIQERPLTAFMEA